MITQHGGIGLLKRCDGGHERVAVLADKSLVEGALNYTYPPSPSQLSETHVSVISLMVKWSSCLPSTLCSRSSDSKRRGFNSLQCMYVLFGVFTPYIKRAIPVMSWESTLLLPLAGIVQRFALTYSFGSVPMFVVY